VNGIHEVRGSIPLSSTKPANNLQHGSKRAVSSGYRDPGTEGSQPSAPRGLSAEPVRFTDKLDSVRLDLAPLASAQKLVGGESSVGDRSTTGPGHLHFLLS
jgi:hypothetical protein